MFIWGPFDLKGFSSISLYWGCSEKNSYLSQSSSQENNLLLEVKSILVGS